MRGQRARTRVVPNMWIGAHRLDHDVRRRGRSQPPADLANPNAHAFRSQPLVAVPELVAPDGSFAQHRRSPPQPASSPAAVARRMPAISASVLCRRRWANNPPAAFNSVRRPAAGRPRPSGSSAARRPRGCRATPPRRRRPPGRSPTRVAGPISSSRPKASPSSRSSSGAARAIRPSSSALVRTARRPSASR